MKKLKLIFNSFSKKERLFFLAVFIIFLITLSVRMVIAVEENSEWLSVRGGTWKEGIVGQPVAINPVISTNTIDEDINSLVYSSFSDLISNYEIQNNGRAYLLKLKEDLKWSDGRPLTSDDVIFTLKTIQNQETRSPLFKSWEGVVAERVSELQIQLNLPAPYSFFMKNLSNLRVIPKHLFGNIPSANIKLSAYNLEPISSGPYRFKSRSVRQDGFMTEYVLTQNENYFGEKPFIDEISFKFYENYEDIIKAFRFRQINGFGSLVPLPNKDYQNLNVVVKKIEMPRYYAVFINPNINPSLKKTELRRALNISVDRNKILTEVFGNEAKIISKPFFKEDGQIQNVEYDPEEARDLINDFKNTKLELTLIVPAIDFLLKTAEVVKNNWQEIGISKINLIALNPEDLSKNVIKPRNYELLLFGNVLENPLDLFPFWHSSQRFYPGLNLALYQNPKVDNALETIRQIDDSVKQQTLFETAAQIIESDVPAIFLFALPYTYMHTPNLEGFTLTTSSSSQGQSQKEFLITPADRFQNINNWSVRKARVLK